MCVLDQKRLTVLNVYHKVGSIKTLTRDKTVRPFLVTLPIVEIFAAPKVVSCASL